MKEGLIPYDDSHFDVIWICLVLGGVTDRGMLKITIDEIRRTLRPGGLIFLVENTTGKISGSRWKFRSIRDYKRLFKFIELQRLDSYIDCGETISIMAGRYKQGLK